jgi:protease-4
MNFFKTLLASMLGTLLAVALFFIFLVILVVAAISGGENTAKELKHSSVLHLKLDQMLVERTTEEGFELPNGFSSEVKKLGLDQIRKVLESAAKDEKIVGLFLECDGVMGAPSSLMDLRDALAKWKSSGKWMYAYAENYSQADYYVASVADSVFMYPAGGFDWRGMNVEMTFYKKLLDDMMIEPRVIRGRGNIYKSAVEPYMYEGMSEPNRKQVAAFIDDIWNRMVSDIAVSREMSEKDLNTLADSLTMVQADAAVSSGMMDGLAYRDQVIQRMREKLGVSSDVKEEDMELATWEEYARTLEDLDGEKSGIAVVYAVGAIESGEGDDQTIGSERIAKALRDARLDKDVKAIVFRVSSPGGSALASDVIWRETVLIKESGKPFYVSMGDFAASGGYYISCNADRIFANPTTITGSIGVFGVVPNLGKFWSDKIGITHDWYMTNDNAGVMSMNKPWNATEAKAAQKSVDIIYDDFITKVSNGRKMAVNNVDSIARGRVWSGEDALQIGLIDELGNLESCIEAIAQQAGLDAYSITEFPEKLDPMEELIRKLSSSKSSELKSLMGDQAYMLDDLKTIASMKGPQARLPFNIRFE